MKKYSIWICLIIVVLSIFALGFNTKTKEEPNLFYQVYLDDELLGTIKSKDKLLRMIDKQGTYIKNKYKTKQVLAPNGLEIKKIVTYKDELDNPEEIYKKIEEKKPFTIPGYRLTLKDGDKTNKIYVTNKNIIEEALENTVKTFVGEEAYQAYQDGTQERITTTGSEIENVYIQTHMTIKKMNIPVTNRIFIDEAELSKYLLYGDNTTDSKYTVQLGDTIEQVAYKNKISPEEFLIYNPQFTSRSNLLFPGQVVTIGMIDPKVQVVVESKVVTDVETKFKTEERYDANRLVGDDEVIQKGENGLVRTTQRVYHMNGSLVSAETQATEELKPTINAIIVRGEKEIPSVGSGAWYWPVNSYSFLRGIEYWVDPDDGVRKAHTGIDIADNCGKPIYAGNNGVVVQATSYYPNGIFVTINHNNGYYSLYAHMSRFVVSVGQVVSKGQIIGYVGQTGQAYGCHLHYEIFTGGLSYYSRNFLDARNFY